MGEVVVEFAPISAVALADPSGLRLHALKIAAAPFPFRFHNISDPGVRHPGALA
jgi:hypothetical protein